MIYFISGGVRSGKSTYAEKLATSLSNDNLIYLATAKNIDSDMNLRIEKHKSDRKQKNFQTIECHKDLFTIIDSISSNDIVLLECLTVLVTNEMLENNLDNDSYIKKIVDDILLIASKAKDLIIVSNDLYGDDLVYNDFVKDYYYIITEISKQLVTHAKSVYEVTLGIPLQRK